MKNYFEQPFILVRKKNIKKVNYMVLIQGLLQRSVYILILRQMLYFFP
jgi:hypothetical protein